MIARHALNGLAAGFVLAGKALVAARLRSQPGGWREVMSVGLRGEPSKFAVSAFGLNPPADLPAALGQFLRTEPDARYRLRHSPSAATRHSAPHADLIVQHFAADGALERIEPHLAPEGREWPAEPGGREKAHAAVVAAYNRTRHRPEARRPLELLAELRGAVSREAAGYATRLLAAACLSVEPLSAGERFHPPRFHTRRGLGFGVLTFVVRAADGTADVWIQAHHSGTDGMPLQELCSRLAAAWAGAPVAFPEPGTHVPARACHIPGEREVFETLSFHDFGPLLRLRKRLNERLAGEVGGDVTLGSLLLWRLAQEPEFAGVKFASTVDVAASGTSQRDVDLVVSKPADFPFDDAGLARYARAFNEQVLSCRNRASAVRAAARAAGLMPNWLHAALLRNSPDQVRETFGAVGLSVVRDARVFVGPLSDVGFPGGFLAVGGVNLPTASGRAVGAVTVKGDRAQAEAYPAALARALARCGEG